MYGKKRGIHEAGANANGRFKKSRPELDTISSGIGSKSKPCTKFYSTAGCPFGESCHFLHNVPGGYNAVAKMMNLPPAPSSRNVPAPAAPPPTANGNSGVAVKTKLCKRYNSAEGCKFGDQCNFAHGEWELGKPAMQPMRAHEDPRAIGLGPIPGHFGPRMDHQPPPQHISGPAASFGVSATAKISVDGSLVGAIIGKSGMNSKQICRQTGVKLAIRDHDTDSSLKNIELEGTFQQISQASAMVEDLIRTVGSQGRAPIGGPGRAPHTAHGGPTPHANNKKTKLCDNFNKGSCTFGDKCHFAHGTAELRKSGI